MILVRMKTNPIFLPAGAHKRRSSRMHLELYDLFRTVIAEVFERDRTFGICTSIESEDTQSIKYVMHSNSTSDLYVLHASFV